MNIERRAAEHPVPGDSELDQVKAANAAYYVALSARDLAAMERVWMAGTEDVNIAPPIRPAVHAGWHAVRANYQAFWATLDELSVSMPDPEMRMHGTVAWVYGIEHTMRKPKNGPASTGTNFGSSIFIKQDGRWRMVFHQAAPISEP